MSRSTCRKPTISHLALSLYVASTFRFLYLPARSYVVMRDKGCSYDALVTRRHPCPFLTEISHHLRSRAIYCACKLASTCVPRSLMVPYKSSRTFKAFVKPPPTPPQGDYYIFFDGGG